MLLCTLGLNLVLIYIISLLLAALFSVLTGAYFIQALAERLDQLLGNPLKSGKQSNCVILLFSHLYNYRVCVFLCVVSSFPSGCSPVDYHFLPSGDSLSAHI